MVNFIKNSVKTSYNFFNYANPNTSGIAKWNSFNLLLASDLKMLIIVGILNTVLLAYAKSKLKLVRGW